MNTTPDFGEIKVVRNGVRTSSTASAVRTVANTEVLPERLVPAIVQPQVTAPKKSALARFWWLPLLLVLGGAAAIWGRNYYQARYVGSDYWAQIPATQDTTLVESLDSSGNPTGMFGVHYFLTAFNEAGESKEVDFIYHAEDEASVPQPGDFVWVSASQTIVVRQHVVPQSEVPASVLTLIEAANH